MSSRQLFRAGVADLSALCDLERRCFWEDAFSRRQIHYLLTKAQAQIWGLRSEQQLIASFAVLLPRSSRPARLYSLAVESEYRGMGIARLMLNGAHTLARRHGHRAIRLEVSVNNEPAIALYLRAGYTFVGDLKSYYQDGSDGIRMQHDLTLNVMGADKNFDSEWCPAEFLECH